MTLKPEVRVRIGRVTANSPPNASLNPELRVRIGRVVITSDSPLNASLKPEVRLRIGRVEVQQIVHLMTLKPEIRG